MIFHAPPRPPAFDGLVSGVPIGMLVAPPTLVW